MKYVEKIQMGHLSHADDVIYNDTWRTMFSDQVSLEAVTLTFNQETKCCKLCAISNGYVDVIGLRLL